MIIIVSGDWLAAGAVVAAAIIAKLALRKGGAL